MTTAAAQDPRSTDELKQALVESLMAVIGAPDDEPTAETAATTLRTLDERLAAEAGAHQGPSGGSGRPRATGTHQPR